MLSLEFWKKQLAPTKLAFNFLFWSLHWGLFAFGWYVEA